MEENKKDVPTSCQKSERFESAFGNTKIVQTKDYISCSISASEQHNSRQHLE